jgi:hypothetical protein
MTTSRQEATAWGHAGSRKSYLFWSRAALSPLFSGKAPQSVFPVLKSDFVALQSAFPVWFA